MKRSSLRAILLIEGLIIIGMLGAAVFFWNTVCGESIVACLRNQDMKVGTFLLLSVIRPFVLTPIEVFALMSGNIYGPYMGTIYTAFSGVLSSAMVFFISNAIGRRVVTPWLQKNLPETHHFVRSQDWKIVTACRLIPMFPFDLATIVFGALDFRWKRVLISTFLGMLPGLFMFSELAGSPSASFLRTFFITMTLLLFLFVIPVLTFEYRSRKSGSSMWMRLKAMLIEIQTEATLNNQIVKRVKYDPEKLPILLLYGFFSSRRSLTVLEKSLTHRGYEVFTFNLGGLLDVFFTKGIIEAAEMVNIKLKRLFHKHGLDRINVVAHSKGGLVAMWWLLRLGGHEHCDRLITMGTPFKGTRLGWLGVVTPLGLILKDLRQMRPGSEMLRELHSTPIPPGLRIYNLYSKRDIVIRDRRGCYEPTPPSEAVQYIPMHQVDHFQYLLRRDVGDVLARILGSPLKRENPVEVLASTETTIDPETPEEWKKSS